MTHTTDDGGPAFPTPQDEFGKNSPSMSLRDYFAGQALIGIVVNDRFVKLASSAGVDWDELVGEISYGVADAMLAARKGGAA